MKNLNFLGGLSTALLLTFGASSHAQSFQKTFYEPGSDMNHYSVETAPNGDYVIAGTIFRPGGNQDINVMRLDAAGNQLWSVILDESNDDRALDVVVDPNGEIVVVGYIEDPASPMDADLYAVKLDAGGNFMADVLVDGFHTAAGTNVIYSNNSGNYIVGGYMGEPFQVPMVGCVSRILELDFNSLNVLNNKELSTGHMKHDNINDIVETSTGYFVTGSMANTVSSPSAGEGVLAVFLDYSFNVIADLSFESTNHEHVGVSAIYDAGADEVWLMSNNSIVHNPQISQIRDVSGGPFISTEYYLYVDPSAGLPNAAGFKLAMSNNSSTLVAAGLFQMNTDYLGNTNSSIPWIVEFERSSGSSLGAYSWPAPSPNFHTHGGGTFSTFSGEHPYFFNQEMMVQRPDRRGFTIISPIQEAGDYGIDVITSLDLSNPDIDMPCFEKIECDPYSISHNLNPVVDDPQSIVETNPNYSLPGIWIPETIWCKSIYDYRSVIESDKEVEKNPSAIRLDGTTITVSPNPVTNSAFIEISGEDLTGYQFTVRDALGQVLFSSAVLESNYYSDRLEMSEFPMGVYFLTLSDTRTGEMEVTKIVKQ